MIPQYLSSEPGLGSTVTNNRGKHGSVNVKTTGKIATKLQSSEHLE